MTDEATDRLEGYCDGAAGKLAQHERGDDYNKAWLDARADNVMLEHVAEWKRRAAITVTA